MKYVLFVVLLFVVNTKQENKEVSSPFGQLRYCLRQSDVLPCVKRQIARNLQEAVQSDTTWPITDYLSIRKDQEWKDNTVNNATELTPDEQIIQGIQDFVRSRSLQIKFVADEANEIQGNICMII